jgi:hypothetical protein
LIDWFRVKRVFKDEEDEEEGKNWISTQVFIEKKKKVVSIKLFLGWIMLILNCTKENELRVKI